MKRLLYSILAITLSIVLFSCIGKNKQPETPKYQYVEPTENIAQIIWEKLCAEDPYINKIMELAKNYQGYQDTKPEPQYLSKTGMLFYHSGDEFDGDYNELAFFQMQCYQMKDLSWIALVYKYCIDYNFDPSHQFDLTCYHFKDGAFLDDQPQVDLPECPQSIMHYKDNYPWSSCALAFDHDGFVMNIRKFWPIRYNWTGEKFVMDPNSVVLCNDFYHGVLDPYNYTRTIHDRFDFYDFKVDQNHGIYYGETNEKVLQLYFEDDHLSAIDILTPKIGIAFAQERVEHPIIYCECPTSKPVGLGQPIKNVIDSEKSEAICNEIVESTKDGLYTLTQHLYVDKTNHKDIYAEYQAKDKNSNIEKFKVYTLPLVITLESELADNNRISDEAKQLWAKINEGNAITSTLPGSFKNIWGSDENGFDAVFRAEDDKGGYLEWKMRYTMFKANDGMLIAFIQKSRYSSYMMEQEVTPEWEEFIYQDGNLQRVEPQLPIPVPSDFPAFIKGDNTVTMQGGEIYLEDDGFRFIAHSDHYSSFGDPAPDSYLQFYMIYCRWNGEEFEVPEYVEEEYEGYDEYYDDFEEIYEDE